MGWSRRGVAALAAAVIAAMAWTPAAGATAPTTPILTGGLLHYTGSATAQDVQDDNNPAGDCNQQHLVIDESLTWDDRYLVGGQAYPYDSTQDQSSYRPNALSFSAPGHGTSDREYSVCDDNEQPVAHYNRCSWDRDAGIPTGWGGTTDLAFGGAGASTSATVTNQQCQNDQGYQDLSDAYDVAGSALYSATYDPHFAIDPARPFHGTTRTQQVTIPSTSCDNLDVASQGPGYGSADWTCSGSGTATLTCGVCVSDIRFQQARQPELTLEDVPDPDAPNPGTYDGNVVVVTATLQNVTPKDLTIGVAFRDATKAGAPKALPLDSIKIVTIAAGQTKQVEYDWDTSGFAWDEGHKPLSDRTIQVLTPYGGAEKEIVVNPKPVVLVHGWNSHASTWSKYQSLLDGVRGDWHAWAVGDGQVPGLMNTDQDDGFALSTNAAQLKQYIEGVRDKTDAAHVDIVAHSMGGLISREYIQNFMPAPPDLRPVVVHLVMLGTPNEGSPCAIPFSLIHRGIPTLQLRPDFVNDIFDKLVVNERGVRLSVDAGNIGVPTCQSSDTGDLVVAQPSAWHTYDDVGVESVNHLSMTGSAAMFSGFVMDHLALWPGDYLGAPRAARSAQPRAARAAAVPPPIQTTELDTRTVPAGGSVDVPIPVGSATALDVTFDAPGQVKSELLDPGGTVQQTQDAGSAAAVQPMRFHHVASPAAGTWTLRLSQAGGADVAVKVGVGVEGSPLDLTATATQPSSGGPVTVSATLDDNGSGVPGATVTAQVISDAGGTQDVTLADAGDGTYRGQTGDLPGGDAFAIVTAIRGSDRRIVSAAAAPPPPPPAPAGGGDGGGGTPPPAGGGGTPAPGPPAPGPAGGDLGGGATAGGGGTATAKRLALRLALATRQHVSRRRGLALRLRCPRACTVTVSGTLRRGHRSVKLHALHRRLRARRTTTLRVRLSRSALRLARHHTVRLALRISARDATGARVTLRRTVKVRA